MSFFKEGTKLMTTTKFGVIEYKTAEIVKDEAKNLTFKEGYDEFVEQFYSKGVVVIGQNGKAYILVKKDVYFGKIEELPGKTGIFVRIHEWKKVQNLKVEFKAIVKEVIAEFKFEKKAV